MADERDARTWVVLELSRAGEIRVEEGSLEDALREHLDLDQQVPIFVPAATYIRDGRRTTIHLMEGYAFVATGLHEASYFGLERDCPYVKQVLAQPGPNGMRVLSTLPDAQISDMRDQLRSEVASDIEEGMQVQIVGGVYSLLEGQVLELIGDEDALIRITLRSLDTIQKIPRVFLEPMSESSDD